MKTILTKIVAPFVFVGSIVGALFAAVRLGWISEETAFWLVPISFTVLFVAVAVFVLFKAPRIWLWPTGTLALVQLVGTLVWLFSRILESLWDPLRYAIGATLFVLLIMLLAWGISTIRARMLEKKMAQGSGTGADLERIRKDMREALELLRRAGQGRNAVYQLPWFLVMGRPAAGKTVAIKNSELGLPVKRDWVKGVGGTYTADWFFTNELIFLDTPGGWVTEGATEDGQETWRELMRLLRKYRGRQPLDGLIVVVPADDLIGLNEDELEDQATNIREVVDLIHEQLDFRFPIYVLVTKCDLVEGFVDFFRGLPSKRRHEILGWSNPEPNEPDAELIVEKGFSTVRRRLQNYRLEMLGKVARRTQARRLFFFTEEFRGLERPLSVFASALFGGDRYSEPPVFRGFYFSSGTQEGAPLGKAMSAVAKAFGLQAPQAEAAEEGTKRSYFLLDLFRELMVGDEGLVGRSATHWWRRRRNTAFGVFAPAAIALALLALSGLALGLNRQTYGRVQTRSPQISVQLLDQRQTAALPTEKKIEEALEQTEQLRAYHKEMTGFSPFRGFGMRRPGELANSSLDLFGEEFSRSVLLPTMAGARAITQTDKSCMNRINVLRSIVWMRTGKRAGYQDLAGLDQIWDLDVPTQSDRAVRVRQSLRRQYAYLKVQVDKGDVDTDLLPGFSVREAARAILDECGQQGSTSALDAFRRWQDACQTTRTPTDVVRCFRGLTQVIATAGTDYEGFLRSFQSLKTDLATLVDDVPEGQIALDLLSQVDVAARQTSDCLSRFDQTIAPLIEKYAVREDMIDQCRVAVTSGSRSERFTNREAIIKQQNAELQPDAEALGTRAFDFASICTGAVDGFNRIDLDLIQQVSSSYRRVACFEEDLRRAVPAVVSVTPANVPQRPRPAPQQQQSTRTADATPTPSRPDRTPASTPAPRSSGAGFFKRSRGVNSAYRPSSIAARQEDWAAELAAIQGAGYSSAQSDYETGRLRGSVSGYGSQFVKAWKAHLASLALEDPTPPVAGWLRDLATAPDFPDHIEQAKTAIAAIPADAEPPFDALGQRVTSSLGKVVEIDVAAYLELLPVIADDIELCQQDGTYASEYQDKLAAGDDSAALVAARKWVRSSVGPGVAGGALTDLFNRPLDEAELILGDMLSTFWNDMVRVYQTQVAGKAPFSSDVFEDEPVEFTGLRALLGRETGAVARVLSATKGKQLSPEAESWLAAAQRISSLFFSEDSDDPRDLSVVALVDAPTYDPPPFAKKYRLEELKVAVSPSHSADWSEEEDDALHLEAVVLGDGKSEFAEVKGNISERKGAFGRMFGKKWKPGEGALAARFDGALAPLKLLAAGLQAGSHTLEYHIEIEWKKDKVGTVTIPMRLTGDDAAPLMDLLSNGLPAPPADFQEQ